MKEDTNNIEKIVSDFFKEDEETLQSIFSQIFTHIANTEFGHADLYYLSKIVTFDQLKTIIEYYDGDKITVPTFKQFNECYFLTLCYFLREEVGMDWKSIKEQLGVTNDDEFFSSISLGKKILSIKDALKKDLKYLVKNIDKSELPEFLKGKINAKPE